MNFINLKLVAKTLAIVVISLQLFVQTSLCQVTDGDDQFQVYHQDIGRISGGANANPSLGQQTIVRQVVPVAAATPVVPATLIEQPAQPIHHQQRNRHSHNLNHQHHHQQQQQQRHHQAPRAQPAAATTTSTRVALGTGRPVTRIVAPVAVELHQASAAAIQAPARTAYVEPSFSSYPQPVAAPAPAQAPPTIITTTSTHHHHAHALASRTQSAGPQLAAEPIAAAGPALSSFRSTSGHTNSVAARHSALMAQVAAERQAALSAAAVSAGSGGDYAPLEAVAPPSHNPNPAHSAQPLLAATSLHHQQSPVAAATPALTFVDQPEEPLVAPSFDHVLSQGCPHKGVFSYPNKDNCDRYYMCTNGTFTEEACPNGLAYGQMGAVYQHCAYNWNVDCGNKKTSEPIASAGCPWQFGIFPVTSAGKCSLDYFVCEWGVPETKRCSPEGLFYDDRIKGCQWADQLGCKSEAVLNFKCPAEDEDNPYWPYPRYYHTKQDVVVCVNEQPRLVHCNEDQIVDPSSLACMDLNKKKKKF